MTRFPLYIVITHPHEGGYFRVDANGKTERYTRDFPSATWYTYADWASFWDAYDAAIPHHVDTSGTIQQKKDTMKAHPPSTPIKRDSESSAMRRIIRPVHVFSDAVAIRSFALLVGLPLWIAGAKYTLDGCIRVGNLLLVWLSQAINTAPVQMPPITNLWVYVGLAGFLGLIFSRIEIGQWSSVRQRRQTHGVVVIMWGLANIIDVGSTYAGVTSLGVAIFPLQLWVTHTPVAAGVWSAVITYLPETLLVFAFRIQRN